MHQITCPSCDFELDQRTWSQSAGLIPEDINYISLRLSRNYLARLDQNNTETISNYINQTIIVQITLSNGS